MEFFNLLWIFLLLASLVPLVRQRMLDASRLRVIRKLEQTRGRRVFLRVDGSTAGKHVISWFSHRPLY